MKMAKAAPELDTCRLYPSKTDFKAGNMLHGEHSLPSTPKDRLLEFEIAFERIYEDLNGRVSARSHGFQAKTMAVAESDKHLGTLFAAMVIGEGEQVQTITDPIDVWEEFKDLLAEHDACKFDT